MNNLYAIYLRPTIITLGLIFNSFLFTLAHAETPIDSVFFQRMTYFQKEFLPSKLAENLSKNSFREEQILSFYAKRGYSPFWYDNLESIQELSQAIKQTSAHGLPQMRYDFISEIGNIDIYDFEILAMESFFKLVTDLNSGLLEPSKVDSAISVYPEKIALGEVFSKISEPKFEKQSFVEKIYSFAPNSLEYTKVGFRIRAFT